MKTLRLFLLLLALGCVLPVEGKGSFNKILLTNPHNGSSLDVSNIETFHHFFIFDWQYGAVTAPTVSTVGYEIRRGWLIEDEASMFDLVIYYPDQPTYIYYAGILSADGTLCSTCSEYDGHWYKLTPEAEAALQAVVSDQKHELLLHRITYMFSNLVITILGLIANTI